MARPIKAKKPFHVIATGYNAEDFYGISAGDASLPIGIDESCIKWFATEFQASQHPAAIAYQRQQEKQKLLNKVETMKTPDAYTGKRFDAWRWLQTYPTQTESDAATFDAVQFPDLAIEVDNTNKTPYEAATLIMEAVAKTQAQEAERVQLREKLKNDNSI